jgi:hypothetical protein
MKKSVLLIIMGFLLAGSFVLALDLDLEREQRIIYGKVLYIKEINITPYEISPGEDAKINIELENIGDSRLRDVILRLNLPSEFSPSIGDITEKKIREMQGSSIEKIYFSVTALPDASPGIYRIPVDISYLNKIGDTIQENNTIGIAIAAEPELLVSISDSEIFNGNNLGDVTVRIVNKGLTEIKFLTVEVLDSEDYSIISANKDYLGDVDSDDFEDAEFKINLVKEKNNIDIPLKFEYRDSNNKKYSEELIINLNIPEKSQVSSSSGINVWLIILVSVIVIYILYRVVKKVKKRKA